MLLFLNRIIIFCLNKKTIGKYFLTILSLKECLLAFKRASFEFLNIGIQLRSAFHYQICHTNNFTLGKLIIHFFFYILSNLSSFDKYHVSIVQLICFYVMIYIILLLSSICTRYSSNSVCRSFCRACIFTYEKYLFHRRVFNTQYIGVIDQKTPYII